MTELDIAQAFSLFTFAAGVLIGYSVKGILALRRIAFMLRHRDFGDRTSEGLYRDGGYIDAIHDFQLSERQLRQEYRQKAVQHQLWGQAKLVPK